MTLISAVSSAIAGPAVICILSASVTQVGRTAITRLGADIPALVTFALGNGQHQKHDNHTQDHPDLHVHLMFPPSVSSLKNVERL
jgi:hypothetical protein